MKKYGKYIAAYGSAFLISLFGLVWRMFSQNNTVIFVLVVLSILPVLLFVANLLLSKQYIKKIKRAKVADMQGYMLRHRTEAEKTSVVLLRKLQGLRRTATVYAVFLGILAASASLLGGMLYTIGIRGSKGLCFVGSIFVILISE